MYRYVPAALAIAASPLPALANETGANETGANETGAEETADRPAIIVTAASPLGADDTADRPIRRSPHAISIADDLTRTAPGFTIAEMQGNPLQPDIAYRGFTASPLLGTPQGLSAYLDGVRINQPFGDVVSWDLVPTNIISAITPISGAAPQFGRNALGGALAVSTRDGRSDPGITAAVSTGSAGRLTAEAQAGGAADNGLHWFLAADHFRENGWRALSPSRATRAFAKLGWANGTSDIALSGLFADSDLNGNGLQEMRLLAADRSSIYTAPDNTQNRGWLFNLKGRHALSDAISFSGNAFWRRIRTATYNGDINDEALGQSLYQPDDAEIAALTAAGYNNLPLAGENQDNTPLPQWRCIANVLLNEEPNEKCNGLVNRSATDQDEWGGGAELAITGTLAQIEHRLTLGLSYANSRAQFGQTTQFGYLLADRTIMPVAGPGAFADGTQNSEDRFDARVNLNSRTASLGAYFLESAQLTPRLRLDLAGRYDRTSVHNRDRITPGGGTGSLDSDPTYARFNPGATLIWTQGKGLSASLSWSQASRAPSAIELGCSDPESPCRLPNALAGDPPLRQVIARNIEAGLTFRQDRWSVSASAFRADSSDDILFVSGGSAGFGYFRNFGKTRRQGVTAQASAAWGAFSLSANYTLLDATYRSPESVGGAANSSNDAASPGFDGSIAITPGDPLPLIPRHSLKAQATWAAARWLALRMDMAAISGVYARGNENGQHRADGLYYLGPGKTDGYAVFNLGADVTPARNVVLTLTLRNIFNRQYNTAAQLGPTGFDATGRYVARPFAGPVLDGDRPMLSSTFLSPAAPRSVQLGLRIRL